MDEPVEKLAMEEEGIVKFSNENTPKTRMLSGCNKAMNCSSMSYEESTPFHKRSERLAKTPTCGSFHIQVDQPSLCDSINNPFENHNTIDSLLQPSFSPSVFMTNASSESGSQRTPGSFWSIDQIAVLKPTDIDLSLLHKQQEFLRLDPVTEKKAQQAIDEFFASNLEMPSPWSAERSGSHFLALISPSPAQMKKRANLMTPGAGRPYATSSSASSLSASSQIRFQKFGMKNATSSSAVKNSQEKTKDDNVFLQSTARSTSKTVSTQTTLTLPVTFDLEKVLGQYFTYADEEKKGENTNEVLSNSSLRRKLFFPDGEEPKTPGKDAMVAPSPFKPIDGGHNIRKLVASPLAQTPLMMKKSCTPRTPSTCTSHFSSSPLVGGISSDLRTPCSGNPLRFGSNIRRRKMLLGSSEDEELMKIELDEMDSPQLSPVMADSSVRSQSMMQDIEGVDLVEDNDLMPFHVTMSSAAARRPDDKTGLRGDEPFVHKQTGPAESCRKQLILGSPPISPIEPIKSKPFQIKKSSSMNQITFPDARGLSAGDKPFSLCPSPMLSPIACTENKKPNALSSSILSSTTSCHARQKPAFKATEGLESHCPLPELSSADHLAKTGQEASNKMKSSGETKDCHRYSMRDDSYGLCGEGRHLSEKLCADDNKENRLPQDAMYYAAAQDANTREIVGLSENGIMPTKQTDVQIFSHNSNFRSVDSMTHRVSPEGGRLSHFQSELETAGEHLKPNNSEEVLDHQTHSHTGMEMSPRKPLFCNLNIPDRKENVQDQNSSMMDMSLQHYPCSTCCDGDTFINSNNPADTQGDSGYSTAPINTQTS